MKHLPKGSFIQGRKYRIVRFIDSKDFGYVYEAEDTTLGKRVIIVATETKHYVMDFSIESLTDILKIQDEVLPKPVINKCIYQDLSPLNETEAEAIISKIGALPVNDGKRESSPIFQDIYKETQPNIIEGFQELKFNNTPIKLSNTAIYATSGQINGYHYVDLGMSVKWAMCNIGAVDPFDYGDYYAWGEIRTKSGYTGGKSVTYCKDMGNIEGNPIYDVATAKWGGTWRLPTASEIAELLHKCKREWIYDNGHNGYKITGPNGKNIILPATGWRYETALSGAGECGFYWSGSPYGGVVSAYYAFCLNLGKSHFGLDWDCRYHGFTVRPVSE